MEVLQRQCKLCSTILMDENFEIIDDVVRDILKVLLLQLKFDTELQCVMCRDCSSRIYAAFNFKQMCLYTHNSPYPYLDYKKTSPVRFDRICVKEEEPMQVGDNGNICRLCTHIYEKNDYLSLQAVPVEAICLYFPEINFEITGDPEMCQACIETLCMHSAFIKSCSDVNEHSNPILNDSFIKTEEIEIKSEKNDEDLGQNKQANDIYLNSLNLTSYATSGNCESDKFKYKLKHKNSLEYDEKKDRGSSDIQMYNCDTCTYKTQRWSHFSLHQLTHKDPSEVQMYKCDKCEYQTKQRTNLTKHQVRHKDPSEVQMYRCGECAYETSRRYCLKKHQLRHKDSSEVQMYKCDKCTHETKRKSDLILHLLTHKDPSEVPVYKCGKCEYETCRKYNLNVHVLRHQDSSEAQMFKCGECAYETNRRRNLKVHQLRHKDSSEVQMYKCSECDYESKMKRNLKRHALRNHKATNVTCKNPI